MSKASPHQRPPLEVSVLFEPHRLQQDVLRQAYACLIPLSRRPLSSEKPSSGVRYDQSPHPVERRRA